jgi:hypothetical protein
MRLFFLNPFAGESEEVSIMGKYSNLSIMGKDQLFLVSQSKVPTSSFWADTTSLSRA